MSQSSSVAVYPGTFDPITNGHLDILGRALRLFDRVIVTIAVNQRKSPLFIVDFCRRHNATVLVRGLRALADFEYEFQFAHMNRRLAPQVDTVFFMTDE